MHKGGKKQNLTAEIAAAWAGLLRSDDVEALIRQAHKDAACFRRRKVFPKEETPKK